MSTRRTMTTIGTNTRISDFNPAYPLNGTDNDHTSPAPTLGNAFGNASTWGVNIWAPSKTSSFASTAREASRPRENGTSLGTSDTYERRGSRALVESSESDSFQTPWNHSTRRGSATSPPRTRSIAPGQPTQPRTNGSYYAAGGRNASIAQGPVAKPTKQQLNPMSKTFTANQPNDSFSTELARYSMSQTDTMNGYSEVAATPWSDATSLHSPGDDRQSLAASEYFSPTSAAPSRSGSLPPSRHGEPVQFSENYARYAQNNQRQPASISVVNHSYSQERNGSFHSDSLPMLGQTGREQMPDESLLHRTSFSANSFPQMHDYPAVDAGVSRDSNGGAYLPQRADSYSHMGPGTYAPDGQWQGQSNDPNNQFRSFRFENRGTPSGALVRQSPQYSNTHTPPNFDRYQLQQLQQLEHAFSNGANVAMMERKLAGFRQQQILQNQHHVGYQQLPVQQVQLVHNVNMGGNNFRPYYNDMSNAVVVPPNYGAPLQNAVPIVPSGPKDQKDICPKSPFLMDFRMHQTKGTRKYTLKEIYGFLVEFGGDQQGSRFIQNELSKANSEERGRVFEEIYPNACQLMKDVFGNYVIQKFFELGDQSQKRALGNAMKNRMFELSKHAYGCRVVQKAFEHILIEQQAELIQELKDHVIFFVKDQNGNHVIQKAIERIPAVHIQFIIDAFRGSVGALSVEQYGCRVVQRLLEHCGNQTKRFILDEIHAEGDRILSHNYGNYVTQHVLQFGLPEDRTRVIELVQKDLVKYSGHKFASNVVEKCLAYGTEQQRRDIMLKIKERNEKGESNISRLIKDQYGNYVIQKVLDLVNYENFVEFAAALRPEIESNRKNIATKQLAAMEEKLRRFDQAPPALPQRNSMSSTAESLADVPSLTDAQSPQSTDVPSGPSSTVEDLTHTTSTEKALRPLAGLRIATDP